MCVCGKKTKGETDELLLLSVELNEEIDSEKRREIGRPFQVVVAAKQKERHMVCRSA